jgi:hypothetical protein
MEWWTGGARTGAARHASPTEKFVDHPWIDEATPGTWLNPGR